MKIEIAALLFFLVINSDLFAMDGKGAQKVAVLDDQERAARATQELKDLPSEWFKDITPAKLEHFKKLIREGADSCFKKIYGRAVVARSLLMNAVYHAQFTLVDYLLSIGIDADDEYNRCNGVTVLMLAARWEHTKCAQRLIAGGADRIVRTSRGETAFYMVYGTTNEDIIDLLSKTDKLA